MMPTLSVSTNSDDTVKARENKQFEFLYEAKIASYVKRQDQYDSNLGNAYAFLYGHCNKAMQHKLQTRMDFESKIKGNPIELLNVIQEQSIKFHEHKYEMLSLIHI